MEKKYKIKGDDIVVSSLNNLTKEEHKLLNYLSRYTPSCTPTLRSERITLHGDIVDWTFIGAANNKDIISKLDEIFGYNKDVVEGKWDKFRNYWEELGEPSLEIKTGKGWVEVPTPGFYHGSDYRIKGDPNWEVRLAWVNSGKTLEIECDFGSGWGEANGINGTNPDWNFDAVYRIRPEQPARLKAESTKQEVLLGRGNVHLDGGKAIRYNQGKPQLSYLLDTPLANNELAKVFEAGSVKYVKDNWKLGLDNDKLMDSALRHLQTYSNGEEVDAETGCHHLAHAAWNVKVLLEQVLFAKAQTKMVVKIPIILKEDFVNDSVRRFSVTREDLAKILNKDLSYTEKLSDGQKIIFRDAIYIVQG